jgi:hypothetical protein
MRGRYIVLEATHGAMNAVEKPSAGGMFSAMASTRNRLRLPALLVCATALALAAPLVASATTGTGVTRPFRVTLTDKGVTWKPPLRTLDPIVGGRLRITFVNRASGSHWFRIGTRQTKLLPTSRSSLFFFTFTKLGPVAWRAGVGKVQSVGYHGFIRVRLPGSFG